MQVFVREVGAPPRIGPLPSTARIGHAITPLHHGVLRSAFAGQANAILDRRPACGPRTDSASGSTRRRSASGRLAGSASRASRALPGPGSGASATRSGSLFAGRQRSRSRTSTRPRSPPDAVSPTPSCLRAAVFVDSVARPDEPCILAGDFNVRSAGRGRSRSSTGPEWGFARRRAGDRPCPRPRPAPPPRPRAGRTLAGAYGGALLSDHAPIEVRARMTFEEIRAHVPGLRPVRLPERRLGRAARARRLRGGGRGGAWRDLEEGRGGTPFFERILAMRAACGPRSRPRSE